jgi:hypothetical protein
MDFSFAKVSELTPNVVAAVVGALVTLVAALINLRIAWRREVLSRLEGPRGGKPRRGLLPAIVFMVGAAAVGGYALALYLMQSRENESALLRSELRQRADQIQSSAERIENARTLERYSALADARLAEERRRGAEGVAAAVRLAPCRAGGSAAAPAGAGIVSGAGAGSSSVGGNLSPNPGPHTAAGTSVATGTSNAVAGGGSAGSSIGISADAACREEDARHTAVCAVLPARAAALELAVAAAFVTGEGAAVSAPAALGADLGTARIAAAPVERSRSDGKLLCLDAWSWDAQRALELRIVVRYLLADAPLPLAVEPMNS